MIKYIIKRLLMGILVLFGTSLLIFTIARVVPGDVATIALGARATEAAKEALRMEMNLYDPFPVQYVKWLTSAVTGNFGNSFVTKRPVAMDVAQFLPATLELIIMAGVFMVIGTFILGLLAGKYKNTWVDGLIRVLSYIGVALPAFVIGILLLLLPALALAVPPMVQDARILRSSLVDNSAKEYMAVSTGHGLPPNLLIRKYLLKPSATSAITTMGMDFASLMGNAFLVERIFNWPGISRYGINAMLFKDLNAICAVVLIIGITFFVVNLVVDLIVAALDPRMRKGGSK